MRVTCYVESHGGESKVTWTESGLSAGKWKVMD